MQKMELLTYFGIEDMKQFFLIDVFFKKKSI